MDCSKPPKSPRSVLIALLLVCMWSIGYAQSTPDVQLAQSGQAPLKELSLEQLGKIEVTTATKTPETLWKTPAEWGVRVVHSITDKPGP